jgi:lysozyme family protein
MTNFDIAVAFTLKSEGGYVDNPHDKGGATNRGITIHTLSNWRNKTVTKDDIKALTQREAMEIYKANYWAPTHCDALPLPIACLVFDAAVNSGSFNAIKFLQRALGVKDDGIFGKGTLKALNSADIHLLIGYMLDERLEFMRSLKSWEHFGKGWAARLHDLETYVAKL